MMLTEKQQAFADRANKEAVTERDYRNNFVIDTRAFVLKNAGMLSTPEGVEQFKEQLLLDLTGEFIKDTTGELRELVNVD